MYDIKIGLKKAGKGLAVGLLAAAGQAALLYIADPATLHKILDGSVPAVWVALTVPVVSGAAHWGLNWLKNR